MNCTEINTILDYWKDELTLDDWRIGWKVSLQIKEGECCNDILPFVEITGDHEATIDIRLDLCEDDELQVYDFGIDHLIVMALLQIHFGPFNADDFDYSSIKRDLLDDLATRLILEKRRYYDENGNH